MMPARGCALGSFAGLRMTEGMFMGVRTPAGFRLVLGLSMTEREGRAFNGTTECHFDMTRLIPGD